MSKKQIFNAALKQAVKDGLVVKYTTRGGVTRYKLAK